MFRKKETEFQYAPGIEKIIEDIQGGGTIARAELKGIIDELPPLVIVVKIPMDFISRKNGKGYSRRRCCCHGSTSRKRASV